MNEFYRRPEVNIISKHRIVMAIQINLLLWGCESWALRKDLLLKLERCVTRMIRSILNLTMLDIKDQRITLKQLREKKFNNIPSVQTLIDVRTMNFLGHLLRGHVDLPPRQVLVAWVYNIRPMGRPLKSNRESMWQSLRRMMEDVSYVNIDFVGSLKDFYLFALDKAWLQKLIDRMFDPEIPIPARPND